MSTDRTETGVASAGWGVLTGMLVCVSTYRYCVALLRDTLAVPAFPPGGLAYWLCWVLPLVTVTVAGTVALLSARRARPALAGFTVTHLVTGLALCGFGYSVDSIAYHL